MSKWNYQIDLSEPYEKYEYGQLDFVGLAEEYQAILFEFIRNNPAISELHRFDDFEFAVNDLNLSESEEDIDICLEEIYNFADDHRIWINTIGGGK